MIIYSGMLVNKWVRTVKSVNFCMESGAEWQQQISYDFTGVCRINTPRSQHMMDFSAQFFFLTLLCKSDYQCVDESRLQDYREQSNKKLSGSVSVTLWYVPLNDRTPLARLCRVRLDFDTTREREDAQRVEDVKIKQHRNVPVLNKPLWTFEISGGLSDSHAPHCAELALETWCFKFSQCHSDPVKSSIRPRAHCKQEVPTADSAEFYCSFVVVVFFRCLVLLTRRRWWVNWQFWMNCSFKESAV